MKREIDWGNVAMLLVGLLMCIGLLLGANSGAQNTNPQPTYAQTLTLRNPSVWTRFNNNSSTTFPDSASGLNFSTTTTFGPQPTGSVSGVVGFLDIPYVTLPPGNLAQVKILYPVAPTSGTQTWVTLGTLPNALNGNTYVISSSFTVTPALTAGWQTFNSGTDYSPVTVPAGSLIGFWQSTSFANGPGQVNDLSNNFSVSAPLGSAPSGSIGIGVAKGWSVGINAVVTSPGTITPLQAGFDLVQKNNFSASFTNNAWIASPNGTLGDYDWNQPHSIYTHIDRTVIDRLNGGTLALASKGDYRSGTGWSGDGWVLDLEPDTIDGFPLAYRVCYREVGTASPQNVVQSVCTGSRNNIIGDGAGYDILLANAGTGWIGDDHLYVNGADGGGGASGPVYSTAANLGFGYVTTVIGGSGTGYPAETDIIATGGGLHCVVHLGMLSTGGVPNGSLGANSAGQQQVSGCTSTPSCSLAASSGSGATVTCALVVSTPSAPGAPLMVGSPFYGISSDASQGPINIDEFAMFPSFLGPVDDVNFFYQTNWFQQIVGTPPANPPLVIFEDDGGTDPDNEYAFAVALGAHLHGYIRLIGVINDDPSGYCASMWRQMLDQAGLNQIPVAVTTTFTTGGGLCPSSNIATYNASTPLTSSGYVNATTLLRTLLAKYPSTAVHLFTAGQWTGTANLMQSPADGISPLTGAQLIAQDASNGGKIWIQGGVCTPSSPPAASPCSSSSSASDTSNAFDNLQYVVTHNGTMPIYWMGGSPLSTGHGLPYGRTSKDPLFLFYGGAGVRAGFDTVALLPIFTNQFTNPLAITFSGGTGYATYTPITQTGGGSGCPNQVGWLYSPSGVPASVLTEAGENITTQYIDTLAGTAFGCTSLPTLSLPGATGTGVTLTPSLMTTCGVVTITIVSGTATIDLANDAGCTHNLFFETMSVNSAVSADSPFFGWLSNSLMDPPPVGQPRLPN